MPNVKQKLLIIDDDEFVRDIIADYLREAGHEIFEASDGREGLVQFHKIQPDTVLLDLRMPKLDGFEVLATLVKNSPDTPVIIISGQGTMEDVIKALRLGAWDYLIKPIHDFDLLSYSISKVQERASLILQNKSQLEVINQQLEFINKELELKVNERTKELKMALGDLDVVNLSLKRQNIESLMMLSRIIELRPGIYKGHSKNVAEKSVLIAKELGVDEADVQKILFAGLLLQIGKMSLPDKMLTNPFFTLQSYERTEFIQHAFEGEKLLKGLDHLKDVAMLIRCQYERFDGSGVPDGLVGEKIPLGARILSVVQDFYNNLNGMTTGKKLLQSDALKKLNLFKGKHYDPQVVELFINMVNGGPIKVQKLVIQTEWFKLIEGMHITVVKHKDTTYLTNRIATKEIINHIKELRVQLGAGLIIKVQVR